MKLESKFDLGQTVWQISNQGKEIYDPCPSCQGGRIPLPDGRSLGCPRCKETGTITVKQVHCYVVSQEMTVGRVQMMAGGVKNDDTETYMCRETGVGTGNVYYRKDLFASAELAQQECDIRNNTVSEEWGCVECNPEYQVGQYSGYNDWRYCYVHGRTNHVNIDKFCALQAERLKNNPKEEE